MLIFQIKKTPQWKSYFTEEIMEDSDESPPYLPAVKPSAPHPDEEHVVEKPVWEKDFKLFQDYSEKRPNVQVFQIKKCPIALEFTAAHQVAS